MMSRTRAREAAMVALGAVILVGWSPLTVGPGVDCSVGRIARDATTFAAARATGKLESIRICPGAYSTLAGIADGHDRAAASALIALRALSPRSSRDARALVGIADARSRHHTETRIAALNALANGVSLIDRGRDRIILRDMVRSPVDGSIAVPALRVVILLEGDNPSHELLNVLEVRLNNDAAIGRWGTVTGVAREISTIGPSGAVLIPSLESTLTKQLTIVRFEAEPELAQALGSSGRLTALRWSLGPAVLSNPTVDPTSKGFVLAAIIRNGFVADYAEFNQSAWAEFSKAMLDPTNADVAASSHLREAIGGWAKVGNRMPDGLVLQARMIESVMHHSNLDRPTKAMSMQALSAMSHLPQATVQSMDEAQLRAMIAALADVRAFSSDHANAYYRRWPVSTAEFENALARRTDRSKTVSQLKKGLAAYGIPTLALVAFAFVFLKYPLLLLRIDMAAISSMNADKMWWPIAISVKMLQGLAGLRFHTHVQDAWLKKYGRNARARFVGRLVGTERYIPLPVTTQVHRGDHPASLDELSADWLRGTMNREKSAVLITGEGGAGKTTLASHLAYLALADDKLSRLFPFLSYPFIVNDDFDAANISTKDEFLGFIAAHLATVSGPNVHIPVDLVAKMLASRRITVIADGLSEMPQKGFDALQRFLSDETVNAFVGTSRPDWLLSNLEPVVIRPQRLKAGSLRLFMERYIASRGYGGFDAKAIDAEFERLQSHVGEDITPLMARFYIDKRAKDLQGFRAPSVPRIMGDYVRYLNKTHKEGQLLIEDVLRQAKTLAHESCVSSRMYRSSPVSMQRVEARFSMQALPVEYFDRRLTLVHQLEPAQSELEFAIASLCEYLAAVFAVEAASQVGTFSFPKSENLTPDSRRDFLRFLDRVEEYLDDIDNDVLRSTLRDALNALRLN